MSGVVNDFSTGRRLEKKIHLARLGSRLKLAICLSLLDLAFLGQFFLASARFPECRIPWRSPPPILPIAFFVGTHPIFSHLHELTHLVQSSCAVRRLPTEMVNRFYQIDNMDDLREYVSATLCEHYELQNGAFRMTERVLVRGRKPCGIYFCLHGPRMSKFSAIWETDRNQILFYGAGGERFQKTQLIEAPHLGCVAA